MYFKDNRVVYGITPVEILKRDEIYRPPIQKVIGTRGTQSWGNQADFVRDALRAETETVIRGAADDAAKASKLRSWVHDQVAVFGPEVELTTGNSMKPLGILTDIRKGRSANCGPLAVLLIEALRANGIAARMVWMAESVPFRQGFHPALMEAFLNGRWVVMDPTFNREWWVDGRPVSVDEGRQAYWAGRQVNFRGDDKTDLRLKHLFLGYSRALANVFILSELPKWKAELARWPFFKLFFPSILVFERENKRLGAMPFEILNWLTWIVYFVIPVAGDGSFIRRDLLVQNNSGPRGIWNVAPGSIKNIIRNL